MWMSLACSPSIRRVTGMPVQAATMRAMSSASTSSLSSRRAAADRPAASAASCSRAAPGARPAAVLELGGPAVVGRPLGGLDLVLEPLQLRLGRRAARRWPPSPAPTALERAGPLGDVGQLALERLEPGPRRVVLLLAQRLALDLELDAATLQLVELDGHRVHLHAQPAGGLVDEVDGLVGQEAVADVAVREHRGGDERRVGDAHAVVHLVALAQAAQDARSVSSTLGWST